MSREVLTRQAILDAVNSRMDAMTECEGLRVRAIVHDAERRHGANWIPAGLLRPPHMHDEFECWRTVLPYVRELQSRFDIAS